LTWSLGERQILAAGSQYPPLALMQRPRGEVGGSLQPDAACWCGDGCCAGGVTAAMRGGCRAGGGVGAA
jgi:hypothetical protein